MTRGEIERIRFVHADGAREIAMPIQGHGKGRGFEEANSAFVSGDASSLVGQVRRFGSAGPAYEVIGVAGPGEVRVEVVYSGERLDYAVVEVLADPIAETIP